MKKVMFGQGQSITFRQCLNKYNLACPNLGSNQALYYEKYIDIDGMPIKALQLPFDKDICKAT